MARDSTYARRFVGNADADSRAYQQYCQSYLGVTPAQAEALLDAHRHLHHGGRLQPQHVKLMQHVYPSVARQLPGWIDELNEQPAGMRPKYFLAMLSGDLNVLNDRHHEAGEDYRALDKLSSTYHAENIAAEINARRDGGALKPEPAVRREDPLSTRSIVASLFEPRGARAVIDAVNEGEPCTSALVRGLTADRMEEAIERLDPDAEDVDRRGVIEAAYAFHEADSLATDQGWLEERE